MRQHFHLFTNSFPSSKHRIYCIIADGMCKIYNWRSFRVKSVKIFFIKLSLLTLRISSNVDSVDIHFAVAIKCFFFALAGQQNNQKATNAARV